MVKGWGGVRGGYRFEFQWGQKNGKRKKLLTYQKKKNYKGSLRVYFACLITFLSVFILKKSRN